MPYRRKTEGRRDQPAPDKRAVPPPVHEMSAVEETRWGYDGSRFLGLWVTGVAATAFKGVFEVWIQPDDALTTDRWEHIASSATLPIFASSPFIIDGQGYRVALVTRSRWGNSAGPEGSPSATVTIAGGNERPPAVTGFTASVDRGDVLFDWTPIIEQQDYANRRDILKYEIRAGTGWQSATEVGVFGPVNRRWGRAPRSKATGTTFLIKAITRSEVESEDAPASATITAAEGACADAASPVATQEVSIPSAATSVTVTTICPYSAAPRVQFTPGDDVASLPIVDRVTMSQNGDNTWSFTLYATATAPTAGWIFDMFEAEA